MKIKISSVLTHTANTFLAVSFVYLLASLCFFNNSPLLHFAPGLIRMPYQMLMAAVFFGLLILLYNALYALRKFLRNKNISHATIRYIMLLCLFSLQIYIVSSIDTHVNWDACWVIEQAMIAPLMSEYLSEFTNNLLVFFIARFFIVFFEFIGLTDVWWGLSVVIVFLVDFTLLASLAIVKAMKEDSDSAAGLHSGQRRTAHAGLLLVILFTLFLCCSPWQTVFYTDMLLMPVSTALVLAIILAMQAKTREKRLIYAALCGILFVPGWYIKPVVIAIPAAFAVTLLLYVLRNKVRTFSLFFLPIAAGVMSCVITYLAYNYFVEHQKIVTLDKSTRMPMTYTIATGLASEYGIGWQHIPLEDKSTQTKEAAYRSFINDRLNALGASGFLKHIVFKARFITSEGDFFWYSEGSGNDDDFPPPAHNFVENLMFQTGKYYDFYLHAANGLWIVVFLGCCLSMVLSVFSRGFRQRYNDGAFDADLFIRLCAFFGIFVITLTESRSRYLISFLPLFCIISANGYAGVIDWLKECCNQRKLRLSV